MRYFETRPRRKEGRQVYISLESQARPTLRFSRRVLDGVIESFRASSDPFVHISTLPVPIYGWPRRRRYSHVYEQGGSLCQLSTALLCSLEFAENIARLDVDSLAVPFDIFLAVSGYSRLVMYPAAFQRSDGPSRASKTFWLDFARSLIGNPFVFTAGEYLCHHSGTFVLVLLLFFAVLVGPRIKTLRRLA